MAPRTFLPAAALLALALPAAAPAVTIDDFETKAFSITNTTPSTTFSQQTMNIPGHCISTRRTVSVTYPVGTTGTQTADLVLGAADDAVDMTFGVGNSSVSYEYIEGGPWDLTAGGANHQVIVRTHGPGASGATITLYLEDDMGSVVGVVANWSGAANYYFPFFSFPGVDMTSVAEIEVQFHSPNGGAWSVSHIQTAPNPLYDIEWDILVDYIDMCPFCPPDPAIWDWNVLGNPPILLGGPTVDVSLTAEGFETAQFGAYDSGGDLGIGGTVAMMDFLWTSSGPYTEGTFTFDVTLGGAVRFNPSLSGPPGIQTAADGIALAYPVVYSDDFGTVWGSTVQTMVLSEAAGQDVEFQNVSVAETFGRAAGTGFTLQFDLVGHSVDEAEPLIDVHLLGGWTTGTTPTGVEGLASTAQTFGLRAVPTVSRTQTVLELSRPAERDGDLEIFDVAGRLLRKFPVAAGESSVTWNGHDEAGRPVAAGVYLARHRNGTGETAIARIVRLR